MIRWNCLICERIYHEEPHGQGDYDEAHDDVCPACRADAAQVRDLTARLAAAEALADRLGEACDEMDVVCRMIWAQKGSAIDKAHERMFAALVEWRRARGGEKE